MGEYRSVHSLLAKDLATSTGVELLKSRASKIARVLNGALLDRGTTIRKIDWAEHVRNKPETR